MGICLEILTFFIGFLQKKLKNQKKKFYNYKPPYKNVPDYFFP